MRENKFQSQLIRDLKKKFPGCLILKNDPNYVQGIPDLLILYSHHWAALECKRSEKASRRPNQDYYVAKMNSMSYATFVYPENKAQVMKDLHILFHCAEEKEKEETH